MILNKSNLPSRWQFDEIIAFFELKRGHDLPVQNRCDGEYPIIGSNGIVGYHNNFISESNGVITGRSGTIGKVYFSKKAYWPLNTSLYISDFKGNNPKYCYYFLSYFPLEKFSTGTGVPTLNRNNIHCQKVAFPPLPEQQKIAEILSTVDKKIYLIDQKIAETQKLKTGLMQKLFSEGVGVLDEQGNWQPHMEFKDSQLGKVPKSWELNKMESYCSIISGVSPSKLQLSDQGYPFFKVEEFNYSEKILTKARNYVSDKDSCHNGNYLLLPKRGAAIFLNKLRIAKGIFQIDTNVMGIKFNNKVADLDFMLYRLLFEKLENMADVSTIPQINNKHINPYIIPLPSLPEQKKIASIISTVYEKIDLLKQQKSETQELKKGLMQKLLTGEWRVPLDESEAA